MRTFWSLSGLLKDDPGLDALEEEQRRIREAEKKAYWDKVKAEEEAFRLQNFPINRG